MAEYIEREAAYRFAQDQLKKETGAYSRGWNHAMNVIKGALHNNDAIPTADVVPVRHGVPVPHYETWLNSDMEPVKTVRIGNECPFCGDTKIKNFCPNCGARMDNKDGD